MKSRICDKMQRKLRCFRTGGIRSDKVHCAGAKSCFMFRRALLPLLAAALAAGLIASPASAQRHANPFQRGDGPFSSWDRPREERAPQRTVSLSEVKSRLFKKYGGDLLSSRPAGEYFLITWKTGDGRILNLRVNASTGQEE